MSLKDLPTFIIPDSSDNEDKTLTCLLCGKKGLDNLSAHIFFKHGMKTDEYKKQTGYEGLFMTSEQAKRIGKLGDRELTRLEKRKNYMTPDEFDLRMAVYDRAKAKCERCGISEEDLLNQNKRGLHLHHKNYDKTIAELNDVELLCSTCHSKIQPNMSARYNKLCKAINKVLEAVEIDLKDENFRETPRRLATYFMENFLSDFEIQQILEECSASIFPNRYEGMVVLKDTPIIGMCPHHLLPVFYRVSIAYIPTDVAIGLSKLHRIAEAIAKTPLMQETYTVSIATYLQRLLVTEDVAIRISGSHTCMIARGVKVPSSEVITSDLRGSFMHDPSTRQEFYSLLMTK